MTRLSVNINKIATLRNARGGNVPNLLQVASDCEKFGAEGITVHPRPDERHIRYKDVYELKKIVTTEYNIEGYPNAEFIDMVLEVKPEQVTLVPDPPDVLTSNAGWDTIEHHDFLTKVVQRFKEVGIRVSIFMECKDAFIEGAAKVGADRIELYTEDYASTYSLDRAKAVAPYIHAAQKAADVGLGINAGHDLSQENLEYFAHEVPNLLEVSIGHALISEALYLGLENTIGIYRRKLQNAQS